MIKQIKVLVVDDSAFMRKVISDLLEEDPHIKVIDRARNGKEAVEKVIKLQPDVVTLDVEMPQMDGLAALREIMRLKPTPVIMVSSLTRQGAETTIKALALGAIDFVTKPSGTISLDMKTVAQELREKVIAAASVAVEKLTGVAALPMIEVKKSTNNKERSGGIGCYCSVYGRASGHTENIRKNRNYIYSTNSYRSAHAQGLYQELCGEIK